ncbi:hypothetical protein HMPREF3214_00901 [Alloscardovia omnicolens]|nr:hypothetical protein HMPREF3214_00901 [Alloscardovia omnicolens]
MPQFFRMWSLSTLWLSVYARRVATRTLFTGERRRYEESDMKKG